MKIIGLLASLFLTFISIGQKSYYFSDPMPSAENSVTTVASSQFGKYVASNGRTYEFSNEGVYVISTSISSISRETIRESSKYSVRNGFIHGVLENDSLPCVTEGERHYFGVKNKDAIIGIGSDNVMCKIDANTYIINVFENGQYIPTRIKFIGKTVSISYFDYEIDTEIFDFIETQKSIETDQYQLIILTPTESEFIKLSNSGIYPDSREYKLTK